MIGYPLSVNNKLNDYIRLANVSMDGSKAEEEILGGEEQLIYEFGTNTAEVGWLVLSRLRILFSPRVLNLAQSSPVTLEGLQFPTLKVWGR